MTNMTRDEALEALHSEATYRKRRVTVVCRCYVSGEWLYDLRYESGKIIQYVPARKVRDVQ